MAGTELTETGISKILKNSQRFSKILNAVNPALASGGFSKLVRQVNPVRVDETFTGLFSFGYAVPLTPESASVANPSADLVFGTDAGAIREQ